ncbi:MAG: glycosyltransferase [Phascolarctobacterium sp.]|nr:glycosyltransferase [Phascolarctobacterium sp.]MEE1230246.1 glycosyltransferase [Phascolarctobacterium sp.]
MTVDKDILVEEQQDRRLLNHVPDAEGMRSNSDRRGFNENDVVERSKKNIEGNHQGVRYVVDYPVEVSMPTRKSLKHLQGHVLNISSSGMLLGFNNGEGNRINVGDVLGLSFEIKPGSMPEGYESKVKLNGTVVRECQDEKGNKRFGIEFEETLAEYIMRKRNRLTLPAVAFFMAVVVFLIIMMRTESVLYFKFNKWLYLYSIVAAIFLLSRYLFAWFYRPVPIDRKYTPPVTIIIPCFNEETWIRRTIISCLNQDYPVNNLEVIVIDDHSTDNSVQVIKDTIDELIAKEARYNVANRLRYYVQPKNAGKREAMAVGAKMAKHDLLVFVDSDSFLNPFAIINLVQPFKDKDMGGVSGRTDVANTYTNGLTKMQAVRYYISFRVMKAAEAYFDAVTCLSGPLSCYRKDLVMENMDAWLHQTFLGQRATFGDDRSMTNFILRKHRTSYQDTAICATIVPNSYEVFLKQQMRWKRSWLRESINASKFMWKKEPFMSLCFYMGVLVPIIAPVIVLYNLVYVPLAYRVFPWTFMLGMLLMSLMMSFAQKLLRKSDTWWYGLWFCLYYEAVLLWQMPIAWVTFWKSNWGTRPTPADVKEQEKSSKKN